MTILNKYLIYLNETKWKRKVEAGELSPKAVENIKAKGLARSREQYQAGIEKGSDAIIKKNKGKVKIGSFSADVGGAHTNINKSEIHLPSKGAYGWQGFEKDKVYVKRHEADELRNLKRLEKKHGNPQVVNFVRKDLNDPSKRATVGSHASPKVLQSELKYSNFSSSLYGDLKEVRAHRNETGEYELVKKMTKKWINKFEKLTSKTQGSVIEKRISSIKAARIKKFLMFLASLLRKFAKVKNLKVSNLVYKIPK